MACILNQPISSYMFAFSNLQDICLELHNVNCLVGDSNNTAGRAGTSVASLEGLLVVALAKVVSASVDNNCALQEN